MKKKVLGNKKREFLLFVERVLAVALAVCLTFIFINSFFHISTPYGTTYHYAVAPIESEKQFEDRDIFRALLEGNMEQITRYVVLCHEMETNGGYDPDKVIDIQTYVNPAQEVAEPGEVAYRLDDLITWGNYGFTYKTYVGTLEELNDIFMHRGQSSIKTENALPADATGERTPDAWNDTDPEADEVTNVFFEAFQGSDEETAEEESSGIRVYDGRLQDNEAKIKEEVTEPGQYALEFLVPRYETVHGKELQQCAASIEEYEILKANLIQTAETLFLNYTEYMAMEKQYLAANTNIGYCYQIEDAEGMHYYTNSELELTGKNADEITAQVQSFGGKFIYYNPDKQLISTNTEIAAKQMRSLLKEYEHMFQENTRVWIWVDTDYPAADSLQMVKADIDAFRPYLYALLLSSLGIAALFILNGIYLTFKEGRRRDEEGLLYYSLLKNDRFPWEICLIITAALETTGVGLIIELLNGYRNGKLPIGYSMMPIALGVLAFVMHEVFLRFYFSTVRRIKAKQLWKTTFIYWLGCKAKVFALKTIHEGSLVTRIWIPYLIFLMMNLILVLLGTGGVIGALLLDILVGIYIYREQRQQEEIVEGIEIIKNGNAKYRIDTLKLHGTNLKLAESVNSIGGGIRKAVESSMKDEKLKTDLITNVSHDIKTPLTSIITYVDLLKRENLEGERVQGYINVLDNKSQRLKQLIDDLVEASKISSGNISIQLEKINFAELVRQALGEFSEKFEESRLQIVTKLPEDPMFIEADSSQLWRVMENLFTNVSKYAMQGTRVYVEMETDEAGRKNSFSIKNISAKYLEVQAEDLTERFIRGDESRQTEGSGLGLSIAKNLIEAQGGEFEIQVDGDLFKVILSFENYIE